MRQPADAEPRAPHRARDDPVVPPRHPATTPSSSASATRLAPRLGASYDWFGDGRAEGVRQLGPLLRLDQVRAGARRVRRRHLARRATARSTRPTCSPCRATNMPGRNLWTDEPGSLPRSAACRTSTRRDPNLKPMSQDAFNAGIEYQLKPEHGADGELRAQQPAAHDRGPRRARERQRGLQVREPRRGHREDDEPVGPDGRRSPTPKPKRQYDALELSLDPPLRRTTGSRSASYVLQPPLRQLRGPRQLRRDLDADDEPLVGDDAAAGRQHRARRAAAPTARGTSTSSCGTRTATSTCSAAWRPTVRTS